MNVVNSVPVWMHLGAWLGFVAGGLMVLLGYKQWRKLHYGVVRQYTDRRLRIASGCAAFVLACVCSVENQAWIEAWFENGATVQHADSALTVGVGVLGAWVAVFVVLWGMLYFVAMTASYATKGRLQIRLEENPQRDEVRNAQRRQRRQRADARRGVEPPKPRPARVPRHREVNSVNMRPR